MKKIALLSTLALSLAACGASPTPRPTPPAVVAPEMARLIRTTAPAQLRATRLSATPTVRGLAVRPASRTAVFRVYGGVDVAGVPSETAQGIKHAYYAGAVTSINIRDQIPLG